MQRQRREWSICNTGFMGDDWGGMLWELRCGDSKESSPALLLTQAARCQRVPAKKYSAMAEKEDNSPLAKYPGDSSPLA